MTFQSPFKVNPHVGSLPSPLKSIDYEAYAEQVKSVSQWSVTEGINFES